MNKAFVCIIFTFTLGLHAQSFINQWYCQLLGDEDIKSGYRELVYTALRDFGIENPEIVPVKKMNHVGSTIARVPLASFTAMGIWFDEEYLDSCTPDERIFQIYHEVAHHIKKHHQKLLAISVLLTAVTGAGLKALYTRLQNQNNEPALPIVAATAAGAVHLFYTTIMPYLVKLQEKEADVAAAQKLVALGFFKIVQARIQELKAEGPRVPTKWWFSSVQQVAYLEKASRLKQVT